MIGSKIKLILQFFFILLLSTSCIYQKKGNSKTADILEYMIFSEFSFLTENGLIFNVTEKIEKNGKDKLRFKINPNLCHNIKVFINNKEVAYTVAKFKKGTHLTVYDNSDKDTINVRFQYKLNKYFKGISAHFSDTLSHLLFESQFVPSLNKDYENNAAPYTIKINVPKGYRVVSSGEVTSTKLPNGKVQFCYLYSNPGHPYISLGKFKKLVAKRNGLTFNAYYCDSRIDTLNVLSIIDRTSSYLEILKDYWSPLDQETFNLVSINRRGGYSQFGTLLLNNSYFLNGIDEQLLMHEVSHNYWGNAVLTKPVLSEGMAQYSTGFLMKETSPNKVIDFYNNLACTYEVLNAEIDNMGDIDLDNRFYKLIAYNGLPLLIRHISQEIGSKAFNKILRHIVEKKTGQTINIHEFLAFYENELCMNQIKKMIFESKNNIPDFEICNIANDTIIITGKNLHGSENSYSIVIELWDQNKLCLKDTFFLPNNGQYKYPIPQQINYTSVILDPYYQYIESNYSNNVWLRNGNNYRIGKPLNLEKYNHYYSFFDNLIDYLVNSEATYKSYCTDAQSNDYLNKLKNNSDIVIKGYSIQNIDSTGNETTFVLSIIFDYKNKTNLSGYIKGILNEESNQPIIKKITRIKL